MPPPQEFSRTLSNEFLVTQTSHIFHAKSARPSLRPSLRKASLDKFERHWPVVVNEIHCHEPLGFENQEFVGGGKDCCMVDIHPDFELYQDNGKYLNQNSIGRSKFRIRKFFSFLCWTVRMFLGDFSVSSSQAMQIKWAILSFCNSAGSCGSWLLALAPKAAQGLGPAKGVSAPGQAWKLEAFKGHSSGCRHVFLWRSLCWKHIP